MYLRSDRKYKSINSDHSVLVWMVLTFTFLDLCKSGDEWKPIRNKHHGVREKKPSAIPKQASYIKTSVISIEFISEASSCFELGKIRQAGVFQILLQSKWEEIPAWLSGYSECEPNKNSCKMIISYSCASTLICFIWMKSGPHTVDMLHLICPLLPVTHPE